MNKDPNQTLLFLKRLRPLLASLAGALVMVLAFFIPAVQDQWDRYQSRQVVNHYIELGDDLEREGKFKMATEAYSKAFELSDEKRLDIEIKRLNAKINMVYADPDWGSELPADLQEIDFQYLLHFQKGEDQSAQRVATLTSYGIFLAHAGRQKEADDIFQAILRQHPDETPALINLGNLQDQEGKKEAAKRSYEKAIRLDPRSVSAHYNLGLLFSEQSKFKDALREFTVAKQLDPQDSVIAHHYKILSARPQK